MPEIIIHKKPDLKEVNGEEFYHIQRSNLPIPWEIGQQIEVGKEYNYFYEYFFDHRMGVKNSAGDFISLNYLLEKIIATHEGKEDPDSDIERIYGYDLLKSLKDASVAIKEYTMLLREIISEQVRVEKFSNLPSRLKCIWVLPNLDSVRYWKPIIEGRILKLSLTGQILKTDAAFLKNDTFSLNEFKKQAEFYWAGIKQEGSNAEEILFSGTIVVLEEIEI